jgi:hypothetical protein
MRDFRKGGLNPANFDQFIKEVEELPNLSRRVVDYLDQFDKYHFIDVDQKDFDKIMQEVFRRIINKSKKCWHPYANSKTCDVDSRGNIKVSAAHSIQNNGVLSQIAENGRVISYMYKGGGISAEVIGKSVASVFWGFCNTHDAIFKPIEYYPYSKTSLQNFLFAYRGFVVSSHKKLEASLLINYDEQSDNDIEANKFLFNEIIYNADYNSMYTEVFEMDTFYPIATSSAFYLDYDFEGNLIIHSDDRMELIFVTLLPQNNKTYFILSYFSMDKHLYGKLGEQLKSRNNLKSDISMLLGAHVENIYFNPIYYETFIEKQMSYINNLLEQSQYDFVRINQNGEIISSISLTPPKYLNNEFGINFFGY